MRSLLFVPAGVPKMLEKAAASGADVVIYDLEDAVRPADKDAARALLAGHLATRAQVGPRVAVRVNDLSTEWHKVDIEAIVPLRPDYLVLPKTTGPVDLETLAASIYPLEQQPGATGIIAIATEAVASVLSLARRPWAHPRLRALMWGGEDLAADMGASANRTASGSYSSPFRLARDLCLLAAKEARVAAIDAVFTDFRNGEALREEAREARCDGFDGKAAIHPAQVPVINEVFCPTQEELDWAQRVLGAIAAAGSGVAVVDGQMIDAPHAVRARRILASARRDPT